MPRTNGLGATLYDSERALTVGFAASWATIHAKLLSVTTVRGVMWRTGMWMHVLTLQLDCFACSRSVKLRPYTSFGKLTQGIRALSDRPAAV